MPESGGLVTVVTYFYQSDRGAFQALLALQRIEREGGLKTIGIADAAVMSAAEERARLKIDKTIEFREGGGGPLSAIFPPSILASRAVGRGAREASVHFAEMGFGANLLSEIGENLPPGGAALVVVVEEPWMDELGNVIGGYADVGRYALAPEASLRYESGGTGA